jgi:hypothetical protein
VGKRPIGYLAAFRFRKGAAKTLIEFVNTRPETEAYERFLAKFAYNEPDRPPVHPWSGSEAEFRDVQEKMRAIWEGRKGSAPNLHFNQHLGFVPPPKGQAPLRPPFMTDWKSGIIHIQISHLNQALWLILLQYSRQLGICENHTRFQDCPSPYFIKYRPNARFCSEECAATAKREAKRRWWDKHRSQVAISKEKRTK